MKTNTIFLTFLMAFASFATFAQSSSDKNIERTFVQSFDLQGNTTVLLDIQNAEIELKTWTNTDISVQMSVSVPLNLEGFLKSLVAAGRYTLKDTPADGVMSLVGANLKRTIIFRGSPWNDKIKCVVYAPAKVTVEVVKPVAAAPLLLVGN